jgi:hypothetical protein
MQMRVAKERPVGNCGPAYGEYAGLKDVPSRLSLVSSPASCAIAGSAMNAAIMATTV